ncbi:hypothetical protein FRC08_010022 [Ceratobasidium sp. 394]|nr:hypothetical protein FRC08_010022 [Ceratobasidium sp. 394]
MGLDVSSFKFLMCAGFRERWDTTPIFRGDVSTHANPRPDRRSLDAGGGLGLVLHWLRSAMAETALAEIFALVPSVLDRYLKFGLDLLLGVLQNMGDARITWPTHLRMDYYSTLIHARHPLINGAFGFMDGLSLPVSVSADPELEKATYNGWLHTHKISNILVFAPDGTIIAATLNAPGSWHDARVAQEVFTKLVRSTPDDRFLIADSAFPRTSPIIRARIRTPFKRDAVLPANPEEREAAIKYSNALVSARQAAEWGMRSIQGSFGRLRVPLNINDPEGRAMLLETVVRLHNLRTRLVGVNQIRTVYMRRWFNRPPMAHGIWSPGGWDGSA